MRRGWIKILKMFYLFCKYFFHLFFFLSMKLTKKKTIKEKGNENKSKNFINSIFFYNKIKINV